MGYTHYWNRDKPEISLDKWQEIRAKIAPILAAHDSILDEVKVNDKHIWFEGVGDDAHETFVLQRCSKLAFPEALDMGHFAFCKTASKPYDPVVVACLIVIATVLKGEDVGFRWSSDGTWPDEHQGGIAICGVDWNDVVGPSEDDDA